MRTTQSRSFCIGFTIVFLLMYTSPLAAKVDCKWVKKATEDVLSRTLNLPTHAYLTLTTRCCTHEIEMIYVDGSLYSRGDGGQWTLANLKQLEEEVAHNLKSKDTCRYLGDEPVSGEMAAKYNLHAKFPKGETDEVLWISKARGLLLREEKDFGESKIVMIWRYEYGDVKAPL